MTRACPVGGGLTFNCVNNVTTALSLAGLGLTGFLPESISELSSLTHVSLGANFLHSTVPSSISSMTSLIFLHLGQNNLSGPVPSLTALGNLETLALFDNPLMVGPLPVDPGKNVNLMSLDVSNTRLEGSLTGFTLAFQ